MIGSSGTARTPSTRVIFSGTDVLLLKPRVVLGRSKERLVRGDDDQQDDQVDHHEPHHSPPQGRPRVRTRPPPHAREVVIAHRTTGVRRRHGSGADGAEGRRVLGPGRLRLRAHAIPARRSAHSTALRKSMAMVVGPTPPTRGVIHPATSSQRSSTSGSSFLPSYRTPPPTTTTPGVRCSGWRIPGEPAAATTMSARWVYFGQSGTPVCTTVTAAFAVGRFCDSSSASGRPRVAPRPSTHTSCPATGIS